MCINENWNIRRNGADVAEEKNVMQVRVGDAAYIIDKDENNKFQVYEGKWESVSLVQSFENAPFELHGKISYDVYDYFYNDGRTMKHVMYVGQESTRIGEIVFFTREEAEANLKEMEEKDGE